jgi:hypothetical protein
MPVRTNSGSDVRSHRRRHTRSADSVGLPAPTQGRHHHPKDPDRAPGVVALISGAFACGASVGLYNTSGPSHTAWVTLFWDAVVIALLSALFIFSRKAHHVAKEHGFLDRQRRSRTRPEAQIGPRSPVHPRHWRLRAHSAQKLLVQVLEMLGHGQSEVYLSPLSLSYERYGHGSDHLRPAEHARAGDPA